MGDIKDSSPLVSVIVRTCGRPDILKNALNSINDQNYSNIEVVLVEDGENISEGFARSNFPQLTINYYCSHEKVGRCVIGNIGMKMAQGKYINFLDDDDLLLEHHISTLVEALKRNSKKVAYAIAEEHQIKIDHNGKPHVKRKLVRFKQPFSRLLLCYKNYLPIQSVMFEKELFETEGGFEEDSEILEDWDLWLRYSLKCDFQYVPEITSVYFTPYRGRKKTQRDKELKESREFFENKHNSYMVNMYS